MPQLNPNPWFYTMLLSWLTFSLIIQPKIATFMSTNNPISKVHTPAKTAPWTWPWT